MAGVNKVMIQLGGYIQQNIPKVEIVPKDGVSFLYIIWKKLSKNPFTCQADQNLLLLTLDKDICFFTYDDESHVYAYKEDRLQMFMLHTSLLTQILQDNHSDNDSFVLAPLQIVIQS